MPVCIGYWFSLCKTICSAHSLTYLIWFYVGFMLSIPFLMVQHSEAKLVSIFILPLKERETPSATYPSKGFYSWLKGGDWDRGRRHDPARVRHRSLSRDNHHQVQKSLWNWVGFLWSQFETQSPLRFRGVKLKDGVISPPTGGWEASPLYIAVNPVAEEQVLVLASWCNSWQ